MATINASIVLISLPAIFRGIGLDPLAPGQHQLPAVDADGLPARHRGAGGDARPARRHVGRVRIYNLGFVVFTVASIAAVARPVPRRQAGALWLIVLAGRAGRRRRDADGQLDRDPHRRVPAARARHGAGHQPGRRRSPARSSGWSSAACWPSGTGARSSWSASRSASSARSGRTGSLHETGAAAAGRGSTGGATSPSPSG